MLLIFFYPPAFFLGVCIAIYGLFIAMRGMLAVDEAVIRGAAARIAGCALLSIGTTICFGVYTLIAMSTRSYSWATDIGMHWRGILAGSFVILSGVFTWSGIRERSLPVGSFALGAAVLAAFLQTPPETL